MLNFWNFDVNTDIINNNNELKFQENFNIKTRYTKTQIHFDYNVQCQ